MRTSYFTFGQGHRHERAGGVVFDKDIVVKITAEDPREVMMSLFGIKWCMEYTSPPDMGFYPRGIIEIVRPSAKREWLRKMALDGNVTASFLLKDLP